MDVTLLKYDQNGNRLWTYTYSTLDSEMPQAFLLDASGNSYVAIIQGPSNENQHVIKVNASGVLQIDSLFANYYQGLSINEFKFAPGGGFLITSRYYDAISQFHSVLTKLDGTFHTLWTNDYTDHVIQAISTDASGNIISAENDSTNWHSALRLKKFGPAGNLIWSQTYPSLGFETASYNMISDNSGNRYFAFNTNTSYTNHPDAYVVKFDSSGTFQWSYQVQNPGWQCEFSWYVAFLNDGSLLLNSFRETNGNFNAWNILELTHLDVNGNVLGLVDIGMPHLTQMLMSETGINPLTGDLAVLSAMTILDQFQLTKLCYAGDCKPNVGGTVYLDGNSDCLAGSSETKIPGRMISVNNGQYFTITDSLGNYLMHQAPGTYSITENIPMYWNETCPGPLTAILSLPWDSSMHNDFGNEFTPNVIDLSVYSNISAVRTGFNQYATIHYENHGTIAQSAIVSLDLDPVFNYQSSIPAPSLISGSHYEWNISSLAPMSGGNIVLFTDVSSTVAIGTNYNNAVQITPAGTDVYLTDNNDNDLGLVRGAYDPNNKTVSPSGLILPADSVLTYTINFQNTGTDTAFTICIVDTLSSNLDLLPLHVLCSSHPVTTEVYGHTLRFTFSNILLPDSNTNEALSHGFVCFSVEQKPNLSPGTIIPNVANIYFDFNAPIITNNAADTLQDPLSVAVYDSGHRLSVYPNPVHDKFALDLGNVSCPVSIQLFDVAGKMIREQQLIYVPGHTVIAMEDITEGAYMLRVQGGDFCEMVKIIRQ
jgi:uncharacterized repeat protein (TIGR01451 family)